MPMPFEFQDFAMYQPTKSAASSNLRPVGLPVAAVLAVPVPGAVDRLREAVGRGDVPGRHAHERGRRRPDLPRKLDFAPDDRHLHRHRRAPFPGRRVDRVAPRGTLREDGADVVLVRRRAAVDIAATAARRNEKHRRKAASLYRVRGITALPPVFFGSCSRERRMSEIPSRNAGAAHPNRRACDPRAAREAPGAAPGAGHMDRSAGRYMDNPHLAVRPGP